MVSEGLEGLILAAITDLWDSNVEVEGDEASCIARARAVAYPPMMVAVAAAGYKRRLGGKATAQELAADKRTARSIGYSLMRVVEDCDQQEINWIDLKGEVELEHRQEAGAVRWLQWLPAHAAACRREAVWTATWVMKMNLGSTVVRAIAIRLDASAVRMADILQQIKNA